MLTLSLALPVFEKAIVLTGQRKGALGFSISERAKTDMDGGFNTGAEADSFAGANAGNGAGTDANTGADDGADGVQLGEAVASEVAGLRAGAQRTSTLTLT